MREVHSNKEMSPGPDSSCSICDKVLKKEEYLTHFKDYHSDVKLGCPKCPQTFSSTDRLRSHYKSSHQQMSLSGVKSNSESKPTDSDSDRHQEEVTSPKDITTCSICNQVFSKDEYLTHFKEYHSEVRLGCPKCPSNFSSPDLLREHFKKVHQSKRIDDIGN